MVRAALLVALAVGAGCRDDTPDPPAAATTPLVQQAYLWQLRWTPEVEAAALSAASETDGLVVLGAEVAFDDRAKPTVRRADVPWERFAGREVGVALRVGPYHPPLTPESAATKLLAGLAVELVDAVREAGARVAELQLDFDCPTRRLDEYGIWLRAIREAAPGVKLTITGLPDWLRSDALGELLALTDGWVLQVHSLDPPERVGAPITLCDPAAARAAIAKAAALGAPFRVALPTYGYRVAFDATGRFLGLGAEAETAPWPEGATIRTARSDPQELAALIAELRTVRPAPLEGVLWFRVPVPSDELSWAPATWRAVREGRAPSPELAVRLEARGPGLLDVVLTNPGEAAAPMPARVRLSYRSAPLFAEGLAGYSATRGADETTLAGATGPDRRIPPGGRQVVGWLRFPSPVDPTEVTIHAD